MVSHMKGYTIYRLMLNLTNKFNRNECQLCIVCDHISNILVWGLFYYEALAG